MKDGRAARISSLLLQGVLDLMALATGMLAGFRQVASHEQLRGLESWVEQVYRGVVPILLGRRLDPTEPVQPLVFAAALTLVLLSVKMAFRTSTVSGLPDLEAI